MSDISISEDELKLIINQMNSESLEISKCFEDISKLFDTLTLEGEIADSVISKFDAISANFPIVKNNVESCVTDLEHLITKFNEQSSSISLGEVNLAKGGETVNVKG